MASMDHFHISLLAAAALASFSSSPDYECSFSFGAMPPRCSWSIPALLLCPSGTNGGAMLLLLSLSWHSTCPMNFHLLLFTSLVGVLMSVLSSSSFVSTLAVLPLYFPYAPQALVVEHINGVIISLHFPVSHPHCYSNTGVTRAL